MAFRVAQNIHQALLERAKPEEEQAANIVRLLRPSYAVGTAVNTELLELLKE